MTVLSECGVHGVSGGTCLRWAVGKCAYLEMAFDAVFSRRRSRRHSLSPRGEAIAVPPLFNDSRGGLGRPEGESRRGWRRAEAAPR